MWLGHSIIIKWWNDIILFESINLFLSHLYFKEKKDSDNFNTWLMFDYFKSKAIIADKSLDSHPINQNINDSEEADFLIDELTIYKGASIIKYIYYLDEEVFWQSMKPFVSHNLNKSVCHLQFLEIYETLYIDLDDNNYANVSRNTSTSTENCSNDLSPINQLKFYFNNAKLPRLSYVTLLNSFFISKSNHVMIHTLIN